LRQLGARAPIQIWRRGVITQWVASGAIVGAGRAWPGITTSCGSGLCHRLARPPA